MAEKKPSEVLGGWSQQVAEQLGAIAENTGGTETRTASAEKRPSDVLGGWHKEVSDLLDDIAANTEGGEYVLPTMSPTTKGGATVGEGLTMDGTALSVDYSEVASVDALEGATALSPTGGIVSTQDGLAISTAQQTTGAIDGALLELTAKSKPATQAGTVGKNLLNYDAWKDTPIGRGTAVWENNGVTLTATENDCYTEFGSRNFSENARVAISEGQSLTLSWAADTDSSGSIFIFPNGSTTGLVQVNNSTAKSLTYTAGAGVTFISFRFGVSTAGATIRYSDIQIELGSTATEYELYTGGAPSPSPDYPQPIVTVRGRNLLNASREYSVAQNATWLNVPCELKNGERYVFSYVPSTTAGAVTFKGVTKGGETKVIVSQVTNSVHRVEFVANDDYVSVNSYSNTALTITEPMITTFDERDLPYVPYGYVGLERRDSQGTLLDTTPIPLPSRGWVAGLPDGTADELSVDGAGKVVWSKETEETTLSSSWSWRLDSDGTESRRFSTWSIDSIGMRLNKNAGMFSHFVFENENSREWGIASCRATGWIVLNDKKSVMPTVADLQSWLSTHPVTILYPLATPVTETCGYIDLPDMQDCMLSIPELDALGVRYTIGDGAEIARQWYARAHSEYEQRITDLEEAVAELTAGA